MLIVEDDPRDQATLARILGEAGYSTEVVSTGEGAIARCAERAFDAVTLDLILPDMTGLDVLGRLRNDGKHGEVPVIVITVVTERATAGFSVHDVLGKPVSGDAVLQSLARAHVRPGARGPVFVVDDAPSSLKLMETLLLGLGFAVTCYSEGAAALAAVGREHPQAIVLDLLMPELDGFEFLNRLRRSPEGATVPVLVWTMKDLSTEELAGLRASAVTVVRKGAAGAELTATLRRCLSPPHPGGADAG